jgi:hypothetical protein
MKKYRVPIPPDFNLPKNIKEGAPFEVLAKISLTDKGELEIVSFDGVEVYDVEAAKKEEEELLKEIEEAEMEMASDELEKPAAAIADEKGFMKAVMSDPRTAEAFN